MDLLHAASQPALLRWLVNRAAPSLPAYWQEEAAGELAVQLVARERRGGEGRPLRYVALDAVRKVTGEWRWRGGAPHWSLCDELYVFSEADAMLDDLGAARAERLRERWLDEETEDQLVEWIGVTAAERDRRMTESSRDLRLIDVAA